jgi:hypothetical protein
MSMDWRQISNGQIEPFADIGDEKHFRNWSENLKPTAELKMNKCPNIKLSPISRKEEFNKHRSAVIK